MGSGIAMGCTVRPVAGRAFEDILDGYFPLAESVRQLMARHGFASVWLTLLHAPVMNIEGLPPTAPVPFSLRKTYSGMIESMTVAVTQDEDAVHMNGMGEWFWVDGREDTGRFPASTRLGEPAFVRGIGIMASQESADRAPSRATVSLARVAPEAQLRDRLGAATAALGWTSSRAWGLGASGHDGIRRTSSFNGVGSIFGDRIDAADRGTAGLSAEIPEAESGAGYVLLDISADQADAEALELALLV